MKIIAVNLLVLAFLAMLANPLSYLTIEGYVGFKNLLAGPQPGGANDRWDLPPFKDKAESHRLMAEFNALETEYSPFVEWRRLPFSGQLTTVGSDHFRVTPQAAEAGPGKAGLFGGSTMWGTGAPDNGTIAARFAERNPHYRVTNYGESGFNSRQSLDRLISLYSTGERFDLVVFYDGVNDVASHCRSELSIPSHEREDQLRQAVELSRQMLGIEGLFYHTRRLAEIIKRKLTRTAQPSAAVTGYSCADHPERARLTAQVMVQNWRMARDLVESRGGRFVAVLQPVAYVGRPDVSYLPMPPELAAEYQAVYPLIQREMAGDAFAFDFTAAFDDKTLYIDYCHVTKDGNDIIASMLTSVVPAAGRK